MNRMPWLARDVTIKVLLEWSETHLLTNLFLLLGLVLMKTWQGQGFSSHLGTEIVNTVESGQNQDE